MLILQREKNERIMINDNIIITVVDVQGGRVRIGIDAPNHYKIAREEVYQSSIKPIKNS